MSCLSSQQIASVVCFLLSPAASYITGDTVTVDGAHSLVCGDLMEIPGIESYIELLHFYGYCVDRR